jgi:hypothetical protein
MKMCRVPAIVINRAVADGDDPPWAVAVMMAVSLGTLVVLSATPTFTFAPAPAPIGPTLDGAMLMGQTAP